MKKRIVSFILCALMIVPFSVFSHAAVPAEPTVTKDVVGYISHGSTGVAQPSKTEYDGLTPETSKPSWGMDYGGILGVVQMGGTIVSTGKAFINKTGAAFDNLGPVLMTAVDPKTGIDYRVKDAEGNWDIAGTQKGSFINPGDITIKGDLIFSDIYILTRADGQGMFFVTNNANLVIKETVDFCDLNPDDSVVAPVLKLEKNGTAFLHAVGFSSYEGTGKIYLDKKLIDEGKITVDAFANFNGIVYDETGAVIYDGKNVQKPEDTQDPGADTGTQTPETNKAPATSDKNTSKDTTKETAAAESTSKVTDTQANAADAEAGFPIWIIFVGIGVVAAVVVVVIIVTKKKDTDQE